MPRGLFCLASLYLAIIQFFISYQPLFIKYFSVDEWKTTRYETMPQLIPRSKEKYSFKQSKNEVCAHCLDNSINLTYNAYRVNIARRFICELYRGGFLRIEPHLKLMTDEISLKIKLKTTFHVLNGLFQESDTQLFSIFLTH